MKDAQKFLSKGNVDKAIEIWIQIAGISPDGNTFNYIGDLYTKKGDKDSAIAEYHKSAAKYMDEGFSLKALAIHKKVLNINPKDPTALIALGQLNEEKNIITDAIKYYLAAADVLAKDNKKDELLEVFDKIINLAPDNIKLRVKVSEVYSKEGFVPEAAEEYSNISRLFLARNDLASAQEYLTKAIEIMPGNTGVLISLSELAEKKGDINQATEYLDAAIERAGEDSNILMLKAKLLAGNGQVDDAIVTLSKAASIDPEDIEPRKQLAQLHMKAGDAATAWEEYKQIVDKLIASEKNEDAIAILIKFKDSEPVDNRHKLITIYKLAGDNDNAFSELVGLSEVLVEQGQTEAAITSLKDALELNPGESAAESKLRELESMTAAPEPEAAAPEPEAVAPEPEVAAPEPEAAAPEPEAATPKEKTLEDALSEADVFIKYSLFNDARTLLEEMKVNNPTSKELHHKLRLAYREIGDKELAIAECLALNALFTQEGNAEAAEAEIKVALEIDPSDPRLAQYAPEPAGGGFEAELAEADFYIQQGLMEEASYVYRKILVLSPGNEEIISKLAEIERDIAATAAPEAPAPAAPAAPAAPEIKPFMGEEAESDGLFDFASILGEEESGPEIDDIDSDVLGIFDEFKKGLAQEIATEDAETHYDLGIAYKEMGIVDDAIKEFQVASKDPKYFTQSTSMVGICQTIAGRHDKAIEAFSAAIMKTEANTETWWSLKVDLAMAYEASGKKKEAYELYSEVYGWDVTFRDVAKKYETLKAELGDEAPEPPPSSIEPTEPDDGSGGKKSRVSYI